MSFIVPNDLLKKLFDMLAGTDSAQLAVGGKQSVVGVEISRTAGGDTTQYTAKDILAAAGVTTPIRFQNVARVVGGSGYITKVRARTDQSTCTAQLRVWCYQTSWTTPADNAAFTVLYAQKANCLGYIDLPAFATEGTGSDCATALNITDKLPFVCDAASRDLYVVLEVITASGVNPASGQKFFVQLTADLD